MMTAIFGIAVTCGVVTVCDAAASATWGTADMSATDAGKVSATTAANT
jgi:hypothetical protein